MKKSVRYLTVLIAVMALSSALFAAPCHSNNCPSNTTTLNTATWGGGGGFGGPLKSSSATCNPTSVTLNSPQPRNDHGWAYAFGKLVKSLRTSLDTATWGFTPPPLR
jgi:hypothetical protein